MRRRRGFTLIELLITVIVIGILAAIAIPKFSNKKGGKRRASVERSREGTVDTLALYKDCEVLRAWVTEHSALDFVRCDSSKVSVQ